MKVNKIFQDIKRYKKNEVIIGGYKVYFRLDQRKDLLRFKTTVFADSNYIPPSVRGYVMSHPDIRFNGFQGHLFCDEDHYIVCFSLRIDNSIIDSHLFQEILIHYHCKANELRCLLAELARRDLVAVYSDL